MSALGLAACHGEQREQPRKTSTKVLRRPTEADTLAAVAAEVLVGSRPGTHRSLGCCRLCHGTTQERSTWTDAKRKQESMGKGEVTVCQNVALLAVTAVPRERAAGGAGRNEPKPHCGSSTYGSQPCRRVRARLEVTALNGWANASFGRCCNELGGGRGGSGSHPARMASAKMRLASSHIPRWVAEQAGELQVPKK